jgi:hypothetical protein
MMHSLLEMQNLQQDMQARTEGGRIAAGASSPEEALRLLQASPFYSRLVPQATGLAEQMKIKEDTAARRQENVAAAWKDVLVNSPNDRDSAYKYAHAAFANLSPEDQQQASPVFEKGMDSVFGGDPAGFAQRRIAAGIHAGISPDSMYASYGGIAPQRSDIPQRMGGVLPSIVSGGGQLPFGTTPIAPATATDVQKRQADDLQKHQTDLASTVNSGTGLMQTLDKADDLLSRFDTSSLTERRSVLAGYLQAVGMDPKQVSEIAGGDLSSIQEFNKYLAGVAIQRQSGAMPFGGRMNLPETETWLRNTPDINKQKDAIQDIFNSYRRTHINNVIQQRALTDYMHDNAQNPEAAGHWPSIWWGMQQRKDLNAPGYFVPGTRQPIPETVVMDLISDPTPAHRAAFDKKYGNKTDATPSARFVEDR